MATNINPDHGTFIISLDFELYWGIFEKGDIENRKDYFEKTLNTIPKILELFQQYDIKATWATVGFLFYKDGKDLCQNLPEKQPDYKNKKVSAYRHLASELPNNYPCYHFAPEIIQQIKETPGQEVASHTLSHYYCMEPGQTAETFQADLQQHQKIAKSYNLNLESLVLPRNQYNQKYNQIAFQCGFKAIRTNPDVWFWDINRKETLFKKIFRTADAYIPVFDSTFTINHTKSHILEIPASRFLRPVSGNNFLDRLRIKRIKKEMTHAAKNKKFYHLWWHPHNFGNHPLQALEELNKILNHFNILKIKYNFQSQNMKTFYEKQL